MARPGRDTGIDTRLRAYMLRDRGLNNSAIGRALGVTHQAVGGWFKSGRTESEYRVRSAEGTLPKLTPEQEQAARNNPGPPRTGSRSTIAEAGVRTEAAAAGAAVLRLHTGDGVVGPLLTPAMAASYAEASGYAMALWRALVHAGVPYHEAVEWAARVGAGDDAAQPLRTLYERAKAAGISRLARTIWSGEGAPATAWQVLQRIAPEYAATPADQESVDPFADEPADALTRGLDDAVAVLTG